MKKYSFLFLLCLLLLTACTNDEHTEKTETVPPPDVRIITTDASYIMMRGGYEWTIERAFGQKETTIADVAAPSESLKTRELTLIAKDETLSLEFTVTPDRYHISAWYEDGTSQSVPDLQQLVRDEPVAIEVFAYYPQGYVSYVLPVMFE